MRVLAVLAVGMADDDLVAVRPAQPAETTCPAATAFTEVPVGTGKSTPVW